MKVFYGVMLQSSNKSSFYLINLCKKNEEEKKENLEFSMRTHTHTYMH